MPAPRKNPRDPGAVQRGVASPTESTRAGDGLKQVRESLARARDSARRTLVLRRVFEIVAVLLVAAAVLAVVDYFLRLPRPVRIFNWIVGVGLIVAAWWKWGRPAWGFNPPLTDVATRIERARPEVRGLLASAVDFDEGVHADESPMTRALEREVVARASGSWRREMSGELVNPRPMRKAGAWMLGASALALAALPIRPDLWAIGAARVGAPFVETSWPKRTRVVDLTTAEVHPVGEALPMQASLARSAWSASATPVAVRYRLFSGGQRTGERRELLTWQRVRAGEDQDEGELFERLIEPIADEIEYRFETSDDETEWRRIALVERPAVVSASATITPPEYAAVLTAAPESPVGEVDLGPGTDERAVAPPALSGSRVDMRIALNKPVRPDAALAEQIESIGARLDTDGAEWRLSWTLEKPARLAMSLVDEFGIASADEAVFRFDANEDRPASATVTEPSSDRAVLSTARIGVVGEGRDDVALTWVALERRHLTPAGGAGGAPSGPGGAMEPAGEPAEVVRVEVDQERTANARATLDLSVLGLRPGDELHLTALAMDVLGASRGVGATRSTPRVLRIISETEFAEQVRGMLSEVRQGAIRAVDQQREARREASERGASRATLRGQSQVSERVSRLNEAIDRVDQMVRENGLNDEALSELLGESRRAVEQAGRASNKAQQTLDEAAARAERGEDDESRPEPELNEDEAREVDESQERVEAELERLVSMLDRGEDSWLVRNSLERMAREQASLREQAEAAGLSTAGKSLEELDQRERSELERIVEKQEELARKLEELIEDIRSREQEMREVDPASAQGMSQAADRAEREQVAQQMQQAAQQAGQNQMTNATQRQQQAQDALEEMLEDLERGEQARQEVLRRALQSVMDSIKGLIRAQEQEIQRLAAGAAGNGFSGLDRGMIDLNRNTLGVVDLAQKEGEALAVVVTHLNRAGDAQEQAIGLLRAAEVDATETGAAESRSLERLNEALREAERLAEQIDNAEQERKQRELQKAYREALELQVGVRTDTRPLADMDEIGRRERVMVRRLAEPQAGVRTRMDEIVKQVEELADAKVFKFAHDRAARYMDASSSALEEGEPKAAMAAQDRAVAALQAIIESLKEDAPNNDFADQQQQEQQGGGGGGAGQQQPLIPPAKELKLLRALQIEALAITSDAGEAGDARLVRDAAALQRELSAIGRDLLGRMQQAGPQSPVPVGDGVEEPDAGEGSSSGEQSDDDEQGGGGS